VQFQKQDTTFLTSGASLKTNVDFALMRSIFLQPKMQLMTGITVLAVAIVALVWANATSLVFTPPILANVVISVIALYATLELIPSTLSLFLDAGMFGIDLNKTSKEKVYVEAARLNS